MNDQLFYTHIKTHIQSISPKHESLQIADACLGVGQPCPP